MKRLLAIAVVLTTIACSSVPTLPSSNEAATVDSLQALTAGGGVWTGREEASRGESGGLVVTFTKLGDTGPVNADIVWTSDVTNLTYTGSAHGTLDHLNIEGKSGDT